MKRILLTTTVTVLAAMSPALAQANGYDAHQKCKKGEDKRQIAGGLIGAVAGGILGSQVSGNGARTEGSAIGAVVGGIAGVGIADKTIDCDPVYPESSYSTTTSYPTSSYETSPTYHTTSYQPEPTYHTTSSYQTTPSYQSTSYSTTSPSSSDVYYDQVTVSNHPVYSNPTYGSGVNSYGTTYNTNTVTYPPSGSNSQYQTTYSSHSPSTYVAPELMTHHSAPTHHNVSYSQPSSSYTTTSYSTPSHSYSTPSYSSPRYAIQDSHRSGTHYHGKYACNMHH